MTPSPLTRPVSSCKRHRNLFFQCLAYGKAVAGQVSSRAPLGSKDCRLRAREIEAFHQSEKFYDEN